MPNRRTTIDPLLRSVHAMVHLYGAIPCSEALEIHNRLFPGSDPATMADLERLDLDHEHFTIEEGCIAHECLLLFDQGELRMLLAKQAGKPRYVPDPDEFLRYEDSYYSQSTDAQLRLLEFAKRELHMPDRIATGLMEDLHLVVSTTEYTTKQLLAEFERRGIEWESMTVLERLMPLISAFINNTRCWSNNGHTPLEIRGAVPAPAAPMPVRVKVGRNDPCPCGSGRKYKHCCGSPGIVH